MSYRTYGPLDDPIRTDGDLGFLGIDTYLEPEMLKPGFCQAAENMRMTGDLASVRKGWSFLAATASGPLNTFSYAGGVDEVFASGLYSDPDNENLDWLVLATKSSAIIWNRAVLNGYTVNYYSATAAAANVDTATEEIEITAHKFQTSDTVQLTTTGGLPTGLSLATTYYVIDAGTDDIKLASTAAYASAGTAINLTSQGTGTHTIQSTVILSQAPSIVQANTKVYIMRLGARPLLWDGDTTVTSSPTVDSEFEALSSSASGSGDPFPSTNFALYTRNRLVGSQPPTVPTPTTAHTGAQIILATDTLATNNVTASESEFYLNLGSADWFVGAIPYLENQLICFLRNSVHCITNLNATSIAEHYEITREYGCIAKNSIAQSGAQTYFLSDQGVMVMTPQGDPGKGMGIVVSKVQSEAIPLSRPIADKLGDMNMADIHKAAGVVYDNHYFLSYPANDPGDTLPQNVAVYSILQQAWVSIDRYPDGIEGWVVMPYGSPLRQRLFATMPKGFYLFEETAGLDDSAREIGAVTTGTTAIAGKLQSRSFTFGDLDVKRWKRGQLGANVVNNDAFTVKVNTTDPDSSTTVLSYTASGTEETLLRFGARTRGYSCNIEITSSAGSPSFRHLSVDATDNSLNARREVA